MQHELYMPYFHVSFLFGKKSCPFLRNTIEEDKIMGSMIQQISSSILLIQKTTYSLIFSTINT
ncbi:MAG: hypothetical protein ACTSU4_00445 [Promethearchaeota archaeon]